MENSPKGAAEGTQMLGGFELFKPSIDIIKLNFMTFVALLAVPVLCFAPLYIFGDPSKAQNDGYGIIFMLIGLVAMVLVNPALIYTQIKGAQNIKVEPGEAFQTGLKYVWRVLGANIVTGLIFLVSFIALIVPFFFAYRRYLLVPYYIVGRNMHIGEALTKSAQDSITYKSPMWGLVGVSVLTDLFSAIPVVGWIPGALYGCAPGKRYQEITEASHEQAKKK